MFITMQPNNTHSAIRPAYVLVTSQASEITSDLAKAASRQLVAGVGGDGCCDNGGTLLVISSVPLCSFVRTLDQAQFM